MTESSRSRAPLLAAVRADLERWGPEVAQSALAAGALDLARRLNGRSVSPTAASLLHAQLRTTLLELAKLAPTPEESDGVTDLAAEREARRKAAGIG